MAIPCFLAYRHYNPNFTIEGLVLYEKMTKEEVATAISECPCSGIVHLEYIGAEVLLKPLNSEEISIESATRLILRSEGWFRRSLNFDRSNNDVDWIASSKLPFWARSLRSRDLIDSDYLIEVVNSYLNDHIIDVIILGSDWQFEQVTFQEIAERSDYHSSNLWSIHINNTRKVAWLYFEDDRLKLISARDMIVELPKSNRLLVREVDLSRFKGAPITHLSGLSFESQGAFQPAADSVRSGW